jgi:hypothetical protein
MTKPLAAPRVAIGTLVTNVKMTDWGPGKVLELSSTSGTVHFRDLPTGSQVRRIGVSYMALAELQTDPALDLIGLPQAKGAAKRKRAPAKKKKVVAVKAVEPVEESAEEAAEAASESAE